nr:DNA helicase [Tanacetum cinerariifolium]
MGLPKKPALSCIPTSCDKLAESHGESSCSNQQGNQLRVPHMHADTENAWSEKDATTKSSIMQPSIHGDGIGKHILPCTLTTSQNKNRTTMIINRTDTLNRDKNSHASNIRHCVPYTGKASMTSLGAKVDTSINSGRGPYFFRISCQIYRWIGSMCPQEGLIDLLDNHNALVQLICTAKNKRADVNIPEFKLRLYNVIGTRRYDLPTPETIGAIIFRGKIAMQSKFNLIVEEHSHIPQRVNKLHPCYMALQFPLLFVYGEEGYQKDMKLVNVPSQSTNKQRRVSMNMYYAYQIHDRVIHYNLLPRGSGNFFSSIYDAILRGDRDGSDLGTRTILSVSFTGGPHYMYAHYLDALAICRVHGNPSFFITFTCNAKWPEIQEYMDSYPELTTANRADIVDRVFEQKVCDYIKFVRNTKLFGHITAVLYTIEFQKHGLPHCHSLLWVSLSSKVQQDINVDKYISAELPDPAHDPEAYIVISELVIHGPCGYANKNASCMKDGHKCNCNFLKPYCDATYIDKDGFVHYRRRHTDIDTERQQVRLDNSYVVPFNRALCMRQNKPVIGRLAYIHPNVRDLFYQHLLLCHQKGCRSFREIRTVNGIVFSTNRVACEALGLIGGDQEWVIALQEASLHASPDQLRKLFVQILTFCDVSDPKQLWQKFWKDMSHDIPRRLSRLLQVPEIKQNETEMQAGALFELEPILNSNSRTLKEFRLPMTPRKLLHILENRVIMEEINYNRVVLLQERDTLLPKLNKDQKLILDDILKEVTNNQQALIFVYGHDLLRETDLIIWDEAPMNDRRCFEALDHCLRDILNNLQMVFGDADEIDVDNSSTVEILNEMCIQDGDTAITDLISSIYDGQTFERPTSEHLQKKVIVCPKNETTDIINTQVLSALNEREHVYLSLDDATPHGNDGGETELLYPNEYLNSLKFGGLPPHRLELKVAVEQGDRSEDNNWHSNLRKSLPATHFTHK